MKGRKAGFTKKNFLSWKKKKNFSHSEGKNAYY